MVDIYRRMGVIVCILVAVISSQSWAKVTEKAIKKIQSIEGINEYRLANGLQVLLFPDVSKDKVTVNITYSVGSKHENYGETGMAHLLEHLVFKGTPKHPNIAKELTDHGAEANGTTWLDRTNYYETFKATEKNLNWALDLEADRMVNSFIAQKDLDSEMTVVRNEFEMGENSPFRVLSKHVSASAFRWHNYGNTTIGSRADIENVDIDRLKAFYKKYYRPDNATLVVAGNFDEQKTLKLINKYYSPIKNPTSKMPTLYTVEPDQEGERKVEVRRIYNEQYVMAVYRTPAGTHKDFAPLQLLSVILGDNPSGRMYKNLVETKLARNTWSWLSPFKDPYLFISMAQLDEESDIHKFEKKFLKTVQSFVEKPITQKELERAQRKFSKNFELAFNTPQRVAIELSNWVGLGDWRMMFLNRDRINEATVEDLNRVASYYIKTNNRTLGKFIADKSPQLAKIAQAKSVTQELSSYVGKTVADEGEVFKANPDNIIKRAKYSREERLSIAMLPIKTRGKMVQLSMRLGLGNEKSLRNKAVAGNAAVELLLSGAGQLNKLELSDELDRLKAEGRISGGAHEIYLGFKTTSKNLNELLALIQQVLKTPTYEKKEFDLYVDQRLKYLASIQDKPRAIASIHYRNNISALPKNHVLYPALIGEQVANYKKLKLKDVKKFHKKFYGFNDVDISLVGDFDPIVTEKKVKDLFSGWYSKVKQVDVLAPAAAKPAVIESFNTPEKKNAVFMAGLTFELNENSEDAPAIKLVDHMLGGGFISSRLATRIRQKDGLSYGIRSNVQVSFRGNNSGFSVFAISAPENMTKLVAAFKEEITLAFEEGFANEELAAAKEAYLGRRQVNFENHTALTTKINDQLVDGIDMEWEIKFREKIRNVSLQDVNAVMKKYLKLENFHIVTAGDFDK